MLPYEAANEFEVVHCRVRLVQGLQRGRFWVGVKREVDGGCGTCPGERREVLGGSRLPPVDTFLKGPLFVVQPVGQPLVTGSDGRVAEVPRPDGGEGTVEFVRREVRPSHRRLGDGGGDSPLGRSIGLCQLLNEVRRDRPQSDRHFSTFNRVAGWAPTRRISSALAARIGQHSSVTHGFRRVDRTKISPLPW